MAKPATLIALLSGLDQPGLVARVAGWIYQRRGNILHADQHRDMEAGIFFQRIEWETCANSDEDSLSGLTVEAEAFQTFAATLGMTARVATSQRRPRMAVFVSKTDHCFHDLALRSRAGEFNADLVAVISNHHDLAGAAQGYGLPFHHIPMTGDAKAQAEPRQLAILRELKIDLVVLARFMQVLSDGFLRSFAGPVINIHHSFLPAFAGGQPYKQAHERGVKLIGATAHYATAELDDGPIIQQDVARVTHRHSVADLVRKGRELEKTVLAQAVRWHLENRVLVYGRKTVVFD